MVYIFFTFLGSKLSKMSHYILNDEIEYYVKEEDVLMSFDGKIHSICKENMFFSRVLILLFVVSGPYFNRQNGTFCPGISPCNIDF